MMMRQGGGESGGSGGGRAVVGKGEDNEKGAPHGQRRR